jgi:APA family basic amino acid/polyamine antiporter
MGEEVRDPARTIPRAIVGALTIAVVVYAAVAVAALLVLGPDRLAASAAPLADAVDVAGWDWAGPVVRFGAAAAALGALLALIAGIGRTALAMARHDDLPGWLAAVHPRFRVPHRAEVALAVAIGVLVLTVDLRGAIGFSSVGVLVYYLIANVAAFTQPRDQRRYPRALQLVGAAACTLLVATLPVAAVLAGLGVLAAGLAYRLVRRQLRPA